MDKTNPPRHFDVFKPVGHTVLAFASSDGLEQAAQTLSREGFAGSKLVRYSPAEMIAQADSDIETASPLASLGQELNLVKAYRALAVKGNCFLVVDAPDGEQADRVSALAASLGAASGHRFGSFIIEDVDVGEPPQPQSFESPDRALDGELPAGTGH